MFLLPSVLVGLALAIALGGKPRRLLDVRLRASACVLVALAVQVVLFSRLGTHIPALLQKPLHLASYGLLLAFATANLRVRALVPLQLGILLNSLPIAANGGRMPLSTAAAATAGLNPAATANTSESAHHLTFLGDTFALPSSLPLANAFSIGDVLIGLGMIIFIVTAASDDNDPGRAGSLAAARQLELLPEGVDTETLKLPSGYHAAGPDQPLA